MTPIRTYTILTDCYGSEDGFTVRYFNAGETHEIVGSLAGVLLKAGCIEPVEPIGPWDPAKAVADLVAELREEAGEWQAELAAANRYRKPAA